jgi:hypothetical protein
MRNRLPSISRAALPVNVIAHLPHLLKSTIVHDVCVLEGFSQQGGGI